MTLKSNKRSILTVLLAVLMAVCLALGVYFSMSATSVYAETTDAETTAKEHGSSGNHTGWNKLRDALSGGTTTGTYTGYRFAGEDVYYYYLDEDIKIDSAYHTDNSGDIVVAGNAVMVLCLNGYVLEGSGNRSVIQVGSSATLFLCDCSDGTEEHSVTVYRPEDQQDDGSFTASTDPVTLYGGVITGGNTELTVNAYTSNNGGGILSRGTLYIYGGTIAGNIATYGAGIYSAGSLYIYGGTIYGNAAYAGGGVYTYYSHVDITNLTVKSNYAQERGGGMCLNAGKVAVSDSVVSNNKLFYFNADSRAKGGGIAVCGGVDATLTNLTVTGNIADGTYEDSDEPCGLGGGIAVLDDTTTVTLTNCTVFGNYANYAGGGMGISAITCTVTAENCEFTDNVAGLYGNNLFINGGDTGLVDCTVNSTTAEGAADDDIQIGSDDAGRNSTISVTIDGGEYNGSIEVVGASDGENTSVATVTVKSGIFVQDMTEYTVDGDELIYDSVNGRYTTVTTEVAVAIVNAQADVLMSMATYGWSYADIEALDYDLARAVINAYKAITTATTEYEAATARLAAIEAVSEFVKEYGNKIVNDVQSYIDSAVDGLTNAEGDRETEVGSTETEGDPETTTGETSSYSAHYIMISCVMGVLALAIVAAVVIIVVGNRKKN